MTKRTTTRLLALAGCLAALAAGGCGSDDERGEPIPAATALALEEQLASIESRLELGGDSCAAIGSSNAPEVKRLLAGLPEQVDQDVRAALRQSFDRLFKLTSTQCDEGAGQDTTTTETTPPPVTTETTEPTPPETTTTTTTTETETETTTTTPTTDTGKKKDGKGPGGGDTSGSGGGGDSDGGGGGSGGSGGASPGAVAPGGGGR